MSKGFYRIARAKHVYLRTQQRRLRHVKSIVIRNISLSYFDDFRADPLDIGIFFTVHPLYDVDKTLFQSETLFQSYNPSWESIQFSTAEFGKHSSLSAFVIRLWVELSLSSSNSPSPPSGGNPVPLSVPHLSVHDEEGEKMSVRGARNDRKLAFEKIIDLSDLVYLGTLVNKDGSDYPPNSVVIGMFEGYYSDSGVGGVLTAPAITHSLVDLLPPYSLLEVPRIEVLDSYFYHTLQRTINRQEVLNNATVRANESKGKVEEYLREQEEYFRKKREKETLKMRISLLHRQNQQQERLEKEESERLAKQKAELDLFESDLRDKQKDLKQRIAQYQEDIQGHHKRLDALSCCQKSLFLRQRNMIYELSQTFTIKESKNDKQIFAICQVMLPNSDQMEQTGSADQFGVALGYTAHLVEQLGKVLLVPLQYPIHFNGSRSAISDHISEEAVIDTIKEFPLFLKGSEKAMFQYGLHLLNKDIGQIMQHCEYGRSRSLQKKILPSLKYLLDNLVKDFVYMSKQPWSSTSPRPGRPLSQWSTTSIPINPTNPKAQNGSLSRMSTLSSQSSSLATTITTGLSLTPPTLSPPIPSQLAAADHENFHNMAIPVPPKNASTQPSNAGSRNGIREFIAAERNDVVKNGDSENYGVFRARSNRIIGNHPSEHLPGSVESHEQLHYITTTTGMPAEAGNDDYQVTSSLGIQQDMLEKQTKLSQGDESPTPTPPSFPSSFREEHLEAYGENCSSKVQQQRDTNEHDLNHGHYSSKNMRETSPAGAGMFAPSAKSKDLSSNVNDSSNLSVPDSFESEEQGNIIKDDSSHFESGESSFQLSNDEKGPPRFLSEYAELYDLDVESSMDFPSRRRSSRLVDPSDIQTRRLRAEAREHNLAPEPLKSDFPRNLAPERLKSDFPEPSPSNMGPIFFTVGGFSSVDPSDGEMLTSTPTNQINSDNQLHERIENDLTGTDTLIVKERDYNTLHASCDVSPVVSRDSHSNSELNISDYSGTKDTGPNDSSPKTSTLSLEVPSYVSPTVHTSKQRKEVELVDITSLSSATPPVSSLHGTELSTVNSTLYQTEPKECVSPSSNPSVSDHDRIPSSPSGSVIASSKISFDSALNHTAQPYRSTVATPHVLGSNVDPYEDHYSHSSRTGSGTRLQGNTGSSHSQAESEGDNQFLEDFIDGF